MLHLCSSWGYITHAMVGCFSMQLFRSYYSSNRKVLIHAYMRKAKNTLVYKLDLDINDLSEVSRPLLRFPQEKQCSSATRSVATQGS